MNNSTTIRYTLTQDALDKEYIATGKRSFNKEHTVSLDDTSLTPEQRQILIEARNLNLFAPFSGLTLAKVSLHPADAIFSAGKIKRDPYIFDGEPPLAVIFKHIELMLEDAIRCQCEKPAIDAEIAQRKAEKDAAIRRLHETFEAERKAIAAAREQSRIARSILTWNGDTYLGDLAEAIWATANLDRDTRFKSWIREVKSVDKSQENGYCFVGEWVHDGTVELTGRDTRRVYLVSSTTGSRRNQLTEYGVVEMVGGQLYRTTIATDSARPGWSLRIRDQVAALVGS
jgi:hypothetical protein